MQSYPTSPAQASRPRLLGFVPVDSPAFHLQPGRPLKIISGDDAYFEGNIPCQAACPAGTDVPSYIAAIAEDRYDDAFAINRSANLFPSLLCLICSRPCEAACRRRLIDEPVAIRELKRAAAEHGSQQATKLQPSARPTGKSVAIVGSGPAGLAAALDLRERGYNVTLIEAADEPGGMLRLAIPPFRLPRQVLARQIQSLQAAGVNLVLGQEVGRNLSLSSLTDDHDAVLLAIGCARPTGPKLPGLELPGVYYGLHFMRSVALGQSVQIGSRVVVVGAGLVGMDCARSAMRLGADSVLVCDILGEEELTYDPSERLLAIREGAAVHFRTGPQRLAGEDRLQSVEMVRFGGGNGAPRAAVVGSEWTCHANSVIIATGQSPDISLLRDGSGLMADGRDCIKRDPLSLQAAPPKLFAAGDVCSGPSTVIQAIADGRKVAAAIDSFVRGVDPGDGEGALRKRPLFGWTAQREHERRRGYDGYDHISRHPVAHVSSTGLGLEVEAEAGYTAPVARREAQRCLQCQLSIFHETSRCIVCGRCAEVCPYRALSWVDSARVDSIDGDKQAPALAESRQWRAGAALLIDDDRCIRCALCVGVCPTQSLRLQPFWLRNRSSQGPHLPQPALARR